MNEIRKSIEINMSEFKSFLFKYGKNLIKNKEYEDLFIKESDLLKIFNKNEIKTIFRNKKRVIQ